MSYYKGKPELAKTPTGEKQTITTVMKTTEIMAIPERGLLTETCEHYGIRTECSEVTGKPIAHYFPITKKGKTVGFIKRKLDEPKKSAWSTVGDVSVDTELFGTKSCRETGRVLFCVEGVYDAPSLWQSLVKDKRNGGKYPANVVSINLGTKNALENIESNLSFIEKFGTFCTIFDSDRATPKELKEDIMRGREATAKVQIYLQSLWKNAKTKVTHVELELKDSNEYLIEGKSTQLYDLAAFSQKNYEPEAIVSGGVGLEEVNSAVGTGIPLEAFPELTKLMHGLRPGELTVVLAPPKCGKTSLCKAIHYELLKKQVPTLGAYLEEDLRKTTQSFIAIDNNVHLPKFRSDPSLISDENKMRTMKTILNPKHAFFVDNAKGHINPARCMQIFEYAYAKGAKFIILDHLSYIFSGSEGDNERKEIDQLLTDMAGFVRKTGIHVIAVAHIKRGFGKPIPKNKDGTPKYPYWQEVEESDGRGSGAFEQLCFNMWGLDKQVKEDKSRGYTRIRVLYNREWDWTGLADTLTMDPHTGRLKAVPPDELFVSQEDDEDAE